MTVGQFRLITAVLLLALVSFNHNASAQNTDPCSVVQMERINGGAKIWSPDGRKYLVNDLDKHGNYQIYVGTAGSDERVCISDQKIWSAPRPDRDKMQPIWHPSGRWIIVAGEKESHVGRLLPRSIRQGLLECGVWMDMYATTPDGRRWFKLRTMKGYTGPAFTPDGRKLVWAENVGPIGKSAPFAVWELDGAQFSALDDTPQLDSVFKFALDGKWFEPGNFSPNGHDLLLTSDVGLKDAKGQDQFILDTRTNKLTNLTNTPDVWDEHGLFSPDGKKITFMSSYPYRHLKNSDKILSLKSEFMIMDADGSHLQQLTHFQTKGYPEYTPGGSTAAVAWFNREGTELTATQLLSGKHFPNYNIWRIQLSGPCGNSGSSLDAAEGP
ncbi:MAG TPA: hypothetical protein V6C81_03910 [Planktothrix sp.]